MEVIEEFDARGEPARLFPVLAETSKEGRTLSIVLATMAQVPEFSASVLNALGRRFGKRTSVQCFTEVSFPKLKGESLRPDGLIIVNTGRTRWTALIEAKVGNAALKSDQIESYVRLAKEVGIDAVLTFSNEFASLPEHHPVKIDRRLLRAVGLYHFSWFSILTFINLLSLNDEVEDQDHAFLLSELERFLSHPSAGLKRFDQMSPSWNSVLDKLRSGAPLSRTDDDTLTVVSDWHSALRDLCLLMSRRTGAPTEVRLHPKHRADPRERILHDAAALASRGVFKATLHVPDAAGPIEIETDLNTRTIRALMKLDAPRDKSQQRSRLNWILRQLRDADASNVKLMTHWPGRAPTTCTTVGEALTDPTLHSHQDRAMLPTSFTVMRMATDGRKFSGRKTFIEALENLVVSDFYGEVAQSLSAWRPPAPRLRSNSDAPTAQAEETEASTAAASDPSTLQADAGG